MTHLMDPSHTLLQPSQYNYKWTSCRSMFVCLRDACSHLVLALNPKTYILLDAKSSMAEYLSQYLVYSILSISHTLLLWGTHNLLEDERIHLHALWVQLCSHHTFPNLIFLPVIIVIIIIQEFNITTIIILLMVIITELLLHLQIIVFATILISIIAFCSINLFLFSSDFLLIITT